MGGGMLQALGEVLSSDLILKGAGGAAFLLYKAETWRAHHYIAWAAAIFLGKSMFESGQMVWYRGDRFRLSCGIPACQRDRFV